MTALPVETRPSIWLVIRRDRREFDEPVRQLDEQGRLRRMAEPSDVLTALDRDEPMADLIVIAQAYPDEFSLEAVEAIRRRIPYVPLVGLLGSWCEGEGRSGTPWPGAVRVYWHQWFPRCRRELNGLTSGRPTVWTLPATTPEEERVLFQAKLSHEEALKNEAPKQSSSGMILIHTPHDEMHDWLSLACRRLGHGTVWLKSGDPLRMTGGRTILFDATECRGNEEKRLAELALRFKGTPIVALMDFPRIDDVERAKRAGATVVLSKPVDLDDMLWWLDRLTTELDSGV